tara:strand:- start:105 stop:383 length:279 start_codon:yes stop_codon:yes gene_type:complete
MNETTVKQVADTFPDQYIYQQEVSRPPHYSDGSIEAIDALQSMLTEEQFIGFLRGNAFKYQWRCEKKGSPKKDLEKAQWFLNKLMEVIHTEE